MTYMYQNSSERSEGEKKADYDTTDFNAGLLAEHKIRRTICTSVRVPCTRQGSAYRLPSKKPGIRRTDNWGYSLILIWIVTIYN